MYREKCKTNIDIFVIHYLVIFDVLVEWSIQSCVSLEIFMALGFWIFVPKFEDSGSHIHNMNNIYIKI